MVLSPHTMLFAIYTVWGRGGIILLFAQTLHQPRNPIESGKATLHGLFSLKENVTLEAFLPALDDYLRHLQSAGYVLRWRVEQRKVLGNFDCGLPDFTHYIAIEFPD